LELPAEYTFSYKISIFIEDVAELEEVMFEGVQKLGVTAGASTPDFVIDEVIEYLKRIN